MKALADLWPLLLVAGCGFLVYAVIRLRRRFSPGAVNAGPKTPPDATNLGQSELADDLRRIERRLDTRPESLISRIERSCGELGIRTDDISALAANMTTPEQHIEALLQRLETTLQLPPITTSAPLPTEQATRPTTRATEEPKR